MDSKELREKLGHAYEAGEAIVAEAREKGWNDELHASFDASHKDVGEIQQTLEAMQRQGEARALMLDRREERVDLTKDTEGVAVVKAVQRDIEDRGSYRRFVKYAREGWAGLNAEDLLLYQAECRALATSPDSAGGFLVPEEMLTAITEALLAFGGMRQASTTILRTRAGNPLNVPQNDDTGNVGQILAENAPATENDPDFTELVLGAFKYTSDIVRVSLELLDDNEIQNFEGFLGRMLGVRIGRIQNTHFTVGVGTTEPLGVVVSAVAGTTTALNSVITKDEIIDLITALDPAYVAGSEFMMNNATLGELRKLETTEGFPIWNSVQAATPSLLYGVPIVVNQDMASIATTTIPIIYGQFSNYLIRDVWPIRVTRTTELYWAESQIGLMSLARADGALNDAGTGPIVKLTMAV